MARHRWRNCAATGFALRAIKHKKRPTENPNLAQSKECWRLGRVESLHFCEVRGLEASYCPAKMQGACCASRAQKKGAMTEQIKERREKREERKWPPARFSAFLRCPRGVTGDLTRPWAVGPTNLRFLKVERREKREERREKRSQKRPPENPKLTDSRVFLAPGPPRIASFLQC